jgi:hypothetical protein
MKEIIELPPFLEDYMRLKATELSYTCCMFFDYILTPRDNYAPVVPEMNAHITHAMINYIIENILGVVVNSTVKYTTNYSIVLKSDGVNTGNIIFDFVYSSAKESLINKLDYLQIKSLMSLKAEEYFISYLDHCLNEALLVITDGDLNMSLEEAFKNDVNLEERINKDGDNTIFPKNYGFIDDDENIILQTFVWLFCGLNDWLNKDFLNHDDVEYALNILFPKENIKYDLIKDIDVDNETIGYIKEALFMSDFYYTNEVIDTVGKVIINFRNYGRGKEVVNNRFRQLSIII